MLQLLRIRLFDTCWRLAKLLEDREDGLFNLGYFVMRPIATVAERIDALHQHGKWFLRFTSHVHGSFYGVIHPGYRMRVSHELRSRSAIEQPRGRFQALGRVKIGGMRYRLRTLLILLAIGPPTLAFGRSEYAKYQERERQRQEVDRVLQELKNFI